MLLNLSMEEFLCFVKNNIDLFGIVLISIAIAFLIPRAWKGISSDKKGIPGTLGLPFIGETFSFLSATRSTRGCYDFVRLRRSRYGKWFKTRVFGKIQVFVPTTEGARKIFTNDFVDFNKGYVKSMADAVGPKSLLCVPVETHKRIRRLLSDPFSMPSLAKFVQTFDQMLVQQLRRLEQTGNSFVVHQFTMKVIFDAMCSMLISIKEESLLGEMERHCQTVSDAMLSFPVMIPGTRYYKGIKARQRLMETFKGIIERRRNGIEKHDDFLQSMLRRDSYPASEKLDDSELMDNLLTMIIAGQSTTAAAIMWSVKFLDEFKEAQERIREESIYICKNKQDGASLVLEDLSGMSYGLKVVKETLRMANVLLWYPRVALKDCVIDGFAIRKGWYVDIDATCIHYDPDLYENPTQFNPSRFDETQKPYSFIPFGSGPRTCLGRNMAKVTMLVFLHRLTSGYRWTVDDEDCSLESNAHIPRLSSGCPITLKAL